MTLKFALEVWGDPQFSAFPKAIHFSGEVFRELRGVDHQQGFIVGMSSGGGPIEGTSDHRFVVDHRELVVQLVATGKAGGADLLLLQ